jgi:hypothetical protein
LFIGHYSAGFIAKSFNKEIPLWQLFIGVQFLDILWANLILLGIEKLRVVPGITVTSPLDLYYMPYTHSLIAVIAWSIFAGTLYSYYYNTKPKTVGIIIAFVIFSHWLLDLLVHRPDLGIIGNSYKVGLGIWNYPVLTLIVEIGLLLISMAMYLRSFHTITKKNLLAIIGLALIFSFIQIVNQYGPLPDNDKAIATAALFSYLALALFIGWGEKRFFRES